ncbi:MAG: hypothetical protein K2L99_06815 [Muribaculaceae bacterium]|nr:hypothetical protein [Muribaculaceae bacterium]
MKSTSHISIITLRALLAAIIVTAGGWLPLHASVFKDFIHTYTNTASVGCVFVDVNGTAWVGTTNGLMQYDDLKRDYTIRLAMPEELRVPIHMTYGLSDGRMAVVTRGMKKYIFDPESYLVAEIDTQWLKERGIDAPGSWAIEIAALPHAPAMVVAGSKVYTLDPEPGHKADQVKTLPQNATTLSCDGKYYYIVTPAAIHTYDPASGKFEETPYPFETFATHVVKDSHGNIWLGDKHLYRYDKDNMHWSKLRDNVMVTEIARSDDDIYVGTSASGILHFSDSGEQLSEIHNNPFDINTPVSDHCAHVYVDANDNLWVAYNKSDLSISSHYYDITKGRHIEDLQHKLIKDDIISLLPVDDNTLVAGTDGNGVYVVDAETGATKPATALLRSKVPGAVITSLYLDSRKRLWAGSYRNGLICLSGGNVKRFLPDTSPYSIVEDIDGNIYVGTSGNGLFRIAADLSGEPMAVDINDEVWVQKLSGDRSGKLYAACILYT